MLCRNDNHLVRDPLELEVNSGFPDWQVSDRERFDADRQRRTRDVHLLAPSIDPDSEYRLQEHENRTRRQA
jgi:hypothetical protein